MRRTHHCGVLRPSDVDQQVCVCGWVHSRRDHGGVIFIDLRDRTGLLQIVADPARCGEAVHAAADQCRAEYVLKVIGRVIPRAPELVNPKIDTGGVEILAESIEILNRAKHPPFGIDEEAVALEQRLRYRFIDLRRPPMQRNLEVRHRAAQAARQHLSSRGFLEIETPLLLKATPEGARDFVVPCRVIPGTFYVLPQSPQLMKQTLMAAGCDRYFQLARCLRDEDLRADRQFEHTQIDLEMSFVDQEEAREEIERLMVAVFASAGIELSRPFPTIRYADALERYGSDKPDTRFGMELVDVADIMADSEFGVFLRTIESGGRVKAICVPAQGRLTRRDLDELTGYVAQFGAKGMAWIRMGDEGPSGTPLKFMSDDVQARLFERLGAGPGDYLLFAADTAAVVHESLGRLRLKLARDLGLIPPGAHHMLWVVDFPLFDQNRETGAIEPMHHPFTMPRPECMELIEERPLDVVGQLYDLVYNGAELGSGSLRIHDPEIQLRVLKRIGIDEEEAWRRFGFLLEVFSYGAPPHAGIGLGFDRIVSILAGQDAMDIDIRELIAFPKTSTGRDLMLGAPTRIDADTLRELGIASIVEEDEG